MIAREVEQRADDQGGGRQKMQDEGNLTRAPSRTAAGDADASTTGASQSPTIASQLNTRVAAPVGAERLAEAPFVIAGIGLGAEGQGALEALFASARAGSGAAWVVVHQDEGPDTAAMLLASLPRRTSMPVQAIADGARVERGHVYVAPPGRTPRLEDGRFRLGPTDPHRSRGARIDDFFRSIAASQHEEAVAVVLAGGGSAGTAGAQLVKAAGGLCVAQSPDATRRLDMAATLVRAGYADDALPPEGIAALVERYAKRRALVTEESDEEADAIDDDQRRQLHQIVAALRADTGHYFARYRKSTLLRRIERRMGLAGLLDLGEYTALLRHKPDEARALANDLMISVSGFFRTPEAWETLRTAVVRPFVENHRQGDPVRAWVAACASGEDAYSLAMLLTEEAERIGRRYTFNVFATDTADRSLHRARAGLYPAGIEGDMDPRRLERFFVTDPQGYRVRDELRSLVVFARHDLLRDPPFSRIDLCVCRNVLGYLEPPVQRQVLGMLHSSLAPDGALMVSGAETSQLPAGLFRALDPRSHVLRRLEPTEPPALPAHSSRLPALPVTGVAPRLAQRASPSGVAPAGSASASSGHARPTAFAVQAALLDAFAPPTVVCDGDYRAVYFHGHVDPFLALPAGEPTQDVFELLRPAVRPATRAALHKCAETGEVARVEVSGTGDARVVVTAAAFSIGRRSAGTTAHYRITFDSPAESENDDPLPAAAVAAGVDEDLELELRTVRRELQTTLEAYELNNDELRAAHEEVMAVNEELRSANDELAVAGERMQALNDELRDVNARLRREVEAYERYRDDFGNLVHATAVAVIFLDGSLNVRRFTPAMVDLLEVGADDVGHPVNRLPSKFDGPSLTDDARRVLADLQPADAEVRSASGRWYLRRTLPYRTADDRIDGVVVTFVDISAKKRAERSAFTSRARLQSIIDHLPTGVMLVEPSGRLAFANRRVSALFGQPYPMPCLNGDWTAAVSALRALRRDGEALELDAFPVARVLADTAPVNDEEIAFARTDGTRGAMLVSAAPVSDQDGEMVGVVATLFDISGLKRAEAKLRESEERFRLLVESAPDFAIFMVDPVGIIATWNAGAERITGWSEEEAVGRPCSIVFTPEDRANGAPEREMTTARMTGRAMDERWHQRRDGTRFFASGAMTLVHDPAGGVRGFVKVMRDVTERKRGEERLRDALQTAEALRASAESANRAKDDFIATVSHELRTPLNTIKLWANLLASGRVPEKDAAEGIRMIDRAAQAQQQLIEDLLDVSRMASGQLRLSLRRTPITDAIRSAIEAVRPTAELRGLRLEAELSPNVGVVLADPDRVQQIVWNLLSNAVKFTNAGGYVRTRVSRSGDTVEIRVTDSGVGIAADFLPHVFDRFRQAQAATTRTHRGLGLGLAITRQLVELHGGEVRAASEGEGKGSTFTVRLPLPLQSGGALADAEARVASRADLADTSVLLVEDDDSTADATRRLLEAAGARVRVATSAPAAREALAAEVPDLILSDIGLPGENGLALLRGVRERERAAGDERVPAVALSAFAREEDRRQAIDAGFDAHLPKPVDPTRLMALLERLGGRRAKK